MNIPEAAANIKIGDLRVGRGNPVFLIAEIGTSHGGNKEKAMALIDSALEAGADCAKFQFVFAEEIIHPDTGLVALPGGELPLFDVFRRVEQSLEFFRDLKDYTESKGLVFLCTAFGLRSARILKEIGVKLIKVASPEINHIPLLNELSGYGLPALLSGGVSSLGDIEEALSLFTGRAAILHCVTSYPAPEEDYNLSLLPHLSVIFNVPVGISDHSLDPVLVPALGTALGASIIEKHFTLCREDSGLDDPIALIPEDFLKMTEAVRKAEGLGRERTIKWLSGIYGEKKVKSVLGTGKKVLAPSEKDFYYTTNRSILSLREIKAGEIFSEDNCGVLRSEKNIKPGLHPRFLPLLLGRAAARRIENGRGILWEDLLPPKRY